MPASATGAIADCAHTPPCRVERPGYPLQVNLLTFEKELWLAVNESNIRLEYIRLRVCH